MKKIVLTMFAVLLGVTIMYAESCKDSPVKVEYRADEGNCNYQTRTCCEDGNWSDWDKECGSKSPECKDGENQYAKYIIGYDGPIGIKFCQRTCKNGQWVYGEEKIECRRNGFKPVVTSEGKSCSKYEFVKFAEDGIQYRYKTMSGPQGFNAGLPSHYKEGERCNSNEKNLYRYLEEYNNDRCKSHFLICNQEIFYYIVRHVEEEARYNHHVPSSCTVAAFRGSCNQDNEGKCNIVKGVTVAGSWYKGNKVDEDGHILCGSMTVWEQCQAKSVSANNSCSGWGGKEQWDVDPNIPFN